MNFDNIPISVIEEVEIKSGFLIEELFDDSNKSPYRKRAMAYLAVISRGDVATWEDMGNKTVSELWDLMNGGSEEDPKGVSDVSK
jgi:hypothetical protein